MPGAIERFMPRSDIAERHETIVRAPPDVVYDAARRLDLQSNRVARAIFWLRGKVLGAKGSSSWERRGGFVEDALAGGWGILAETPGREIVVGAATQPWQADVVFRALPPERFAAFSEPGLVKIVWTLEVEPIDDERSCFRTQTRAVATDDEARRRFRRYWRTFAVGILALRWMMLPSVRRRAEATARRMHRAAHRA